MSDLSSGVRYIVETACDTYITDFKPKKTDHDSVKVVHHEDGSLKVIDIDMKKIVAIKVEEVSQRDITENFISKEVQVAVTV